MREPPASPEQTRKQIVATKALLQQAQEEAADARRAQAQAEAGLHTLSEYSGILLTTWKQLRGVLVDCKAQLRVLQDEHEAEAPAAAAEMRAAKLRLELSEVRARLAEVESERQELQDELAEAQNTLLQFQETEVRHDQNGDLHPAKPQEQQGEETGNNHQINHDKRPAPLASVSTATSSGAGNSASSSHASGASSTQCGAYPSATGMALGTLGSAGIPMASPGMAISSPGIGSQGFALRPFGTGLIDANASSFALRPFGSGSTESSQKSREPTGASNPASGAESSHKSRETEDAARTRGCSESSFGSFGCEGDSPPSPSAEGDNGKVPPNSPASSGSGPEVFSMDSDEENEEKDDDDDDDSIDMPVKRGPVPMSIEEVVADERTMEDIARGFARIVIHDAKEAVVRKARRSERLDTPRSVIWRGRVASIIEIAGRPEAKPMVAAFKF